jgi:hypothetical protein
MDLELAGAVLARWQEGLPVYEGTLYKAAEAVGLDPQLALMEARFYDALDSYLLEKRAMSPAERILFSIAAGFDPNTMEKTASAYRLDTDELILQALYARNWQPDMAKLAMMPMQAGPGEGPEMDPTGMMGGQPPIPPEMAAAMGAPPQGDAAVQQDPSARPGWAPPPTAPGQVPPGEDGNMDALLQQAGQANSADAGGGLPPAGGDMNQPPPPPPTPQEKIQQAAPDLPPENVERYAQMMQQVEQETGVTVTDPKQVQKIIQQGQKQDTKVIDEAIKKLDQQAATQQQTAMAGGKPQGSPPPQQPGGAPAGGAGGGMEGTDAAMAKAAAAGRILAIFGL